ncbi:hypothetical protein CsatB_005575 [Cannabis sativa]
MVSRVCISFLICILFVSSLNVISAEETESKESKKEFILTLDQFIFSDTIRIFRENDAQLSTMIAEQVEQAAGLESLTLSVKTINQLRENFVSIDHLCQECQNLIDNHDEIKLLSNARNNLNTTLKFSLKCAVLVTTMMPAQETFLLMNMISRVSPHLRLLRMVVRMFRNTRDQWYH